MSVGSIIMLVMVPVSILSELKYRNLHDRWDVVQKYFKDTKNGKTDKMNENKLVFAQGDVTLAKDTKDDELGFASNDAISLYRSVEIYQWTRMLNYGDDAVYNPYKYEKIWS